MDSIKKVEYEDTLRTIAYLTDSINYMIQGMQEEYFEKYNSKTEREYIALEFNRNRAIMVAIGTVMLQIDDELKQAQIRR